MSVWTSALIYAAVKEATQPRLSRTHLLQDSPLELLEYLQMTLQLQSDLATMKETLKSRHPISSDVPFWSFRSTGPLLASGKDLQSAEEVSILSLVVLTDISSTFITARSKYYPDSWTKMEALTTSIVKAMSTGSADDVIFSGITGMRRRTIPLRFFINLIVQDQLQPTN
jgi:hypothetical protein